MTPLKTINLSAGYRQKKETKEVLTDINLSLNAGSLICLLGMNGSGKSTLLRTLGGFQAPLKGSIHLSEKEINHLSVADRAKQMSFVLTHNYISGMMTVGEVVSLGRYPYTNWLATLTNNDHQLIQDALRLTGMLEEKDTYFDQLSDGQQQKVIISRAVAQDTPIIILDEPTNHLDIGNKAEILQLLQSLAHQKGKSILVSTHDLDLALQMADELWIISGKEVQTGPPEEMLINGSLDVAFPYTGIDLFSGKVIKPATRERAFVEGKGRTAEVTRSALRRLGFHLTEDLPSAGIKVTITNSNTWEFQHNDKIMYLEKIDQLLKELDAI